MGDLEHVIENITGNELITNIIVGVLIVAVTAAVAHFVAKLLRGILHLGEELGEGLPASSIFINLARVAIWWVGGSVVLSTCFNVDVSSLVTALGIGGIAISLGFQDTISNLIGGLQVSLLRIVKPGDNINVSSSQGIVKDVTWRHTTVINSKGEQIIIPNSIINKNALSQLKPPLQVSIPVYIPGKAQDLSASAVQIEERACKAASEVAQLTTSPKLNFTEICEDGFKGTLQFEVAEESSKTKAADAVIRAVAECSSH